MQYDQRIIRRVFVGQLKRVFDEIHKMEVCDKLFPLVQFTTSTSLRDAKCEFVKMKDMSADPHTQPRVVQGWLTFPARPAFHST